MATDMNRIQGEIAENPQVPTFQDVPNNDEDRSIEKMLIGFLQSLLEEVGYVES